MPVTLEAGLPVRAAFSTTRGGVDDGNLSARPDLDDRVLANRDLLARGIGVPARQLAFAQQVHGAAAAVVERVSARANRGGLADVDALVTRTPGIGLVVLGADCMPVLLADEVAGVVGAAHAGRAGLLAGVLQATVAAMRDLGATDIVAAVGPCIGGCCYELPADLVDDLDAGLPGIATRTRRGTPSIDLRTGADLALARAGVHDVRHVGGCTYEQPDLLHSYRRDATTRRQGGVIALPDPGSGVRAPAGQ